MILDGSPKVRVVSFKLSCKRAGGALCAKTSHAELSISLAAGSPYSDEILMTETVAISMPSKGQYRINDMAIGARRIG